MDPKSFDLGDMEMSGSSGIDTLLQNEPKLVSPFKTGRRKVASIGDLSNFLRLSKETLVHRSERELWALKKEGGDYYVERLFDGNGQPLKG